MTIRDLLTLALGMLSIKYRLLLFCCLGSDPLMLPARVLTQEFDSSDYGEGLALPSSFADRPSYVPTCGLGKSEWNSPRSGPTPPPTPTLPSPPRLVRQDARIYGSRPEVDPMATPQLSPQFVPRSPQYSPSRPPSAPVVAAMDLEPLGSPLPTLVLEEPQAPKKKRRSRLPAQAHPTLTIRAQKRVRLSANHIAEMRTRFNEVMDVLDPVCPTCHQRPSDSPAN